MKSLKVLSVVCAWLLTSCLVNTATAEVPLNGLTEAEKRSGWELLFDGKTTDGWRNYKKDSVSDGWVIKDGALVRSGDGAGDIITTGTSILSCFWNTTSPRAETVGLCFM